MANKAGQNITLGLFVITGMLVLVVALYLVGKNQSMFGSTFHLRARFSNVNGLMAGNNIRYSGIQAGTVNKITVIDDSTIEVDLLIMDEMKPFIKDNAYAGIGNEGLMGNKVINITPSGYPGKEVTNGALLITKVAPYTEEMMATLSNTNNNVEAISGNLVYTVNRINQSKALWRILDDTTLSDGLRVSMNNLRLATENINRLSLALAQTITDARSGKGAAGAILADDSVAENLRQSIENISKASKESVSVLARLDSIAAMTSASLDHGNGLANSLLKDPAMVTQVNASLENIEKGTASFQQSMEALKHNFLVRGYFRKEEKRKKKEAR
jgi:phospholipid/cholesterol/gamma-HCH transport system substrate-binding protein